MVLSLAAKTTPIIILHWLIQAFIFEFRVRDFTYMLHAAYRVLDTLFLFLYTLDVTVVLIDLRNAHQDIL